MDIPAATPTTVRDRARRFGLALVGLALVLALLSAADLQWSQYKLLDGPAQFERATIAWNALQLEMAQLRLRNDLWQALADPLAATQRLRSSYAQLAARLRLVDTYRTSPAAALPRIYEGTLGALRAFVAHADRYLGDGAQAAATPAVLQALARELEPLGTPLHELSSGAWHLLTQQQARHNEFIRQQSRQGIALTLFQCILLLLLAAVVLRQLRILLQRRAHLETLARRLDAARLDAESANRAKSVFLANMSHEIRTPFHGMLGMMSLLQETPLSVQQEGYLRTAKESANHLLALLNDILDISKLDSGELQVVPEPVDLARLVREIDALMRAQVQSKELALLITMDADVPRWVQADATRLKQILFNLLSNAVKFTARGQIQLKVEALRENAAERIRFSVVDTGIGMDEATQARLFQRFALGDDSPSRRHGGTGLGLQISRSLAQLMGGDISVKSTLGQGSAFTLTLPLKSVDAPQPGPPAAAAPDAPVRALKVLVAEDHPVNQAYLEAVLDKLGHHAVFAENGEEAVRAAQSEDFDIVLMDLHMPVMDGFAATRAIRALPLPRGAMPIVALTADAFEDSMQRARDAGMDDMLTKPAHLPQLRNLLARFGSGSAPRTPAPAASAGHGGDIVDRAAIEQFQASLSVKEYARLLGRFFETVAGTLSRLRAAAARDDRDAAHAQAHALRGAALSLGLRAVAEQCAALSRDAADPQRPPLQAPLDELDRHLTITHDLCCSLGWLPAAGAERTTP